MKKLKYEILFIILFMTVGIAAVSSNLLINGTTQLVSNPNDFNVYFSNVLVDGEQDLSLIRNNTSLFFDFEFDEIGETKVITYDVTNASKNYDAAVSINCTGSTFHVNISNEFDVNSSISARSTRTGVLTLIMRRSNTGENENTSFRCTINSSAVERTTQVTSDVPAPAIRTFKVGEEIIIGSEKFNVISDNVNTVSMLAQYNIGDDYRQSQTANIVTFSNSNGWEKASDVDVQSFEGNAKNILNSYVEYLRQITNTSVANLSGNLITLKQLQSLSCTISEDYSYTKSETCVNSPYKQWLINEQEWWTRSAGAAQSNSIWFVDTDGKLNGRWFASSTPAGIRPVITIAKDYFDSKIIEFTIDGTTYYAEEGMYWSDWVASEYNTSGYVIYQDELNFQVTLIGMGHPVNSNYDNDDMIKKGYSYVTRSVGWFQPL